VPMLA